MIPVFQLLLCILINKIAVRVIEKHNILYYYLTLLLVSSFNIYLCRETTYWFTGFINYLFPAVFFLAVVASSLYVFDIDVSVRKKFYLVCYV